MNKIETSPSTNSNKSKTGLSQYTNPLKIRPESKTRLESYSPSARNSCEPMSKVKDFCKEKAIKSLKNPNPFFAPLKSPTIHANLHTFTDETAIKHNQILYT